MVTKKLFMIMICIILFAGVISADTFGLIGDFETDNYKVYETNEKYGKINVWDKGQLSEDKKLSETTLDYNTDFCLINCEARGTTTLYYDLELFNDFNVYDLKKNKEKLKDYNQQKIYIKNGTIETEVDNYYQICSINKDGLTECERILNGTKTISENTWKEYNGESLKAGTYEWKITGKKSEKDNLDWTLNIQGLETTEWAEWTSSFNVGLTDYWNFETNENIINGSRNLTGGVGQIIFNDNYGKNGKGGYFDETHNAYVQNGRVPNFLAWDTGTFTLNFWINSTLGTSDLFIRRNPGVAGAGLFIDGTPRIVAYNGLILGTAITLSEWNHIVYVSNSSGACLYKNGVLDDCGPKNSNNHWSDQDLKIGYGNYERYIGYMDEIGVWNRTLSPTEINDLYNDGTGIFYTPNVLPSITLNNPTPYYNSTSDVDDFAFNISYSSGDWINMTFNVWNSSDDEIKDLFWENGTSHADCSVLNSDGTQAEIECIGQGISDEDTYRWNVYGCNDDDLCAWADSNYTFTIDDTAPTIVAIQNLTNQTVFSLPVNSTWIMNVTDNLAGVGGCWYNTSDNATLQYETCNAEIQTQWDTEGDKTVYYWANDTFGNEVSGSQLINIALISATSSHTPDNIGEGGSISFNLYVNKTSIPTTSAYLYFNNTIYNPTTTSANTDYYFFEYNFTVPDEWGNSTGKEYDYYWNYTITGFTTNESTTTDNFTVYSVAFDDCSTYGDLILNFSLYDEADNDYVNATDGATIELDLELTKGSTMWSYSTKWTNNATGSDDLDALVCVPSGVLNNTNYTIDYVLGFQATDHVWEFLYLDNGNLDHNNDLLNSLTNKTKNLIDLKTADSTSFLFNYFDEDGLPVEDSIVHVYRKYIGDGVFREVERAKQDQNGDTIVHLVEEDVIYYFIVSLNSNVLYTTSTYTALCQTTPCTIQIEESGGFQEFENTDDWDLIENGSYTINSNSLTREINLTYTLTDSAEMNMTVYALASDGSYSVVGSDSKTSTSGSLIVTVPTISGNTSFFASVYQNDQFKKSSWVDFEEDAGLYFGNTLSLFLGALIILALGLMAVAEGSLVIVFLMFGMFIAMVLGLVDYRTSAGLNILIYFIISGGIIMWKLTRRNR